MKHLPTLLSHELRMLLVSPATYVAATLFLGFMGLIFTKILEIYSGAPQETSPAIVYFQLFWLPVCVMVPLLTMKCLAEERRLGTIETLLTTPVTTSEVVLAKFAAAYLLYTTLWASTLGFFYFLKRFSGDDRFLDPGPLLGGFLFIAVSGLLFVAIGVLASSVTRNQSVAGILGCVALATLILGGNALSDSTWLEQGLFRPLKSIVDYGHIFAHRDDFARGVIDVRHLLFYASGTALALIFSILSVEAKLLHA
ncbi:MAG: ABC transporter permease subunit [Verrucomicrobia bacterium]|jgi:ABC-2 type transport system permease protein|nr:ABC transporter permease subunit [Verrucomicrobiota bacterium]